MSDRRYRLSDAARDGSVYARKDGDWVKLQDTALEEPEASLSSQLVLANSNGDAEVVLSLDTVGNPATGTLTVGNDNYTTQIDGSEIVLDAQTRIDGCLFLQERDDACTDIAGYGQLWVDSSDSSLYFTGDDGVDVPLTGTGASGVQDLDDLSAVTDATNTERNVLVATGNAVSEDPPASAGTVLVDMRFEGATGLENAGTWDDMVLAGTCAINGSNPKVDTASLDNPAVSGLGPSISVGSGTTHGWRTNEFTVEFWWYPEDALGGNRLWGTVQAIGGGQQDLSIRYDLGTNQPIRVVGPSEVEFMRSTSTFTALDQYHHIALTRDSAGLFTLWVNGVAEDTYDASSQTWSTNDQNVMRVLYTHAGQLDNLLVVDGEDLYGSTTFTPSERTEDYTPAGSEEQGWVSRALGADDIQSGTFADARISESSVTQHQSALTIDESQIAYAGTFARRAFPEEISAAWTFLDTVNFGDPGFESGSITLDSSSYDAVVKINEFGGANDAALILHRHDDSAAVASNLVLSRARGEDASHSDVQDNDVLGRIRFAGYHTDSYWSAASIEARVNGTPGDGDMPTELRFLTTPDASNTPTEALRLEQDQSATFASSVTIENGGTLTLNDSTDADSVSFSHDGTDFNTTFVGTTDWNIGSAGLSRVAFDLGGGSGIIDLLSGATLRIFDSTNNDRWELYHDGTDVINIVSNATTWKVVSLPRFWLADGATLRISDSGDTDYGEFSHDGNDFDMFFTNTSVVTMAGASRLDIKGGMDLRIRDDGNLTINDSTDTDSAVFDHDGTNFNTSFITTANWDIDGLTGAARFLNGRLMVDGEANAASYITVGPRDGTSRGNSQDGSLYLFGDSGGVVYGAQWAVISSNAALLGSSFGGATPISNWQVSVGLQVLSGNTFTVFDSTNVDSIRLSHDGANAEFQFTGTASAFFDSMDHVVFRPNNSGSPNPALSIVTPSHSVGLTSTTSGDILSFTLYNVDGANNPRAGFFLDDTGGRWGLAHTWSSGAEHDFVIASAGTAYLTMDFTNNLNTFAGSHEVFIDGGPLSISDGITAPSATAGRAKIYVDTADGDLKVIFGDGTVKTIVVDT